MDSITQQTLELMKEAVSNSDPSVLQVLQKAGYTQPSTATTGLQGYDLEAPAKILYPVLTPLRNEIPRVGGGFGTQANWKAVTAIDTAIVSPGVSEGNRNAVLTSTMSDYNAVYKGLGKEHNVTFEANYAGQGFIDLRSRAQLEALQALMIDEEYLLVAGNTTSTGIALGTANTPSGTLQTGVGSMTAQATVCYVVELTIDGLRRSSVANGVAAAQIARTNADGSSDTINPGHGAISAESSPVTTASSNLGVNWVVTPKTNGAVGWAWYTGLTGAGNVSLAAITTVPQFNQRADATGTQHANASGLSSDFSQNALVFDGIFTQTAKSGNNGYFKRLGTSGQGATLTADGYGGVVEIDDLLQDRWDNYRLSPDTMWVNSQQARDITKKIVNGAGSGVMRINTDNSGGGSQIDIQGGALVTSYFNKFLGTSLRIRIHPFVPAGTMIFTSSSLPYPANGVPNVWRIKTRQEYYSIEWPLKSRKYEFGVYADEVLQGYFPPANGVIASVVAG